MLSERMIMGRILPRSQAVSPRRQSWARRSAASMIMTLATLAVS